MIIISPFSKQLRNLKKPNPKDYPWWQELINLILEKYPEQTIIQIGVDGEDKFNNTTTMFNKSLDQLKQLLDVCDYFISVDNFFHHFASYHGKRGIVLFGQSDPLIFGDKNNINVLKDRKYLRSNQFDFWENTIYNPDAFVKPQKVLEKISRKLF